MFYTLHRCVKYFFVLLGLLCLYWVYTQREAFEPLWVWQKVYENGGIQKTESLPAVEGEALAILDGHTFQMKSQGKIYSVRLTGFEFPEPPLSGSELRLEKERRDTLRQTVIGRPVRVEITYSNLNSLLGIVHVGATNLNTYYVRTGLGRFNREYVKSAPRRTQYEFFAAARLREKRNILAIQSE